MKHVFNRLLDSLATFFAHRKGLLPIIGILLVVLNWILQFISGETLIAQTNIFLHIGIIVAIIGFLLGWSL